MAELVSIKRNVDVSPGQAAPAVFHCSQGDVGSKIILGLLNNGTAYAIPSGVTVTIEGSESNGSIFTPISATASGSDITFYLTGEMTAVAGPAICQAVLKSGSNILGTANFTLEVESSPMGADAPPVFTDAGWTWMLNKLTTEFVPALGDNIIDAIDSKADQSDLTALSNTVAGHTGSITVLNNTVNTLNRNVTENRQNIALKLDKNQGTANAGKYLKVGADGNVTAEELDVTTDKTLSVADKAADAKAVGDEINVLKADLDALENTLYDIEIEGYSQTFDPVEGTIKQDYIYNYRGYEQSLAGWSYLSVPCQPNTTYLISGTASSSARLYTVLNGDGTVIDWAPSESNVRHDNVEYTTPDNAATLLVNAKNEQGAPGVYDVSQISYIKTPETPIGTETGENVYIIDGGDFTTQVNLHGTPNKTVSFNAINANGSLFKTASDDVCPTNFIRAWYVGANHGFNYGFNLTIPNHGLTVANIGTAYTDPVDGYTWILLSIVDANTVLTCTTSGFWYGMGNPSASAYPASVNFGTGALTVNACTKVQIYPSVKDVSVAVVENNAEKFVVNEQYSIIDPASGLTYIQNHIGSNTNTSFCDRSNSLMDVNNRYTFDKRGNCVITSNLIADKAAQLNFFGGTQSQAFGSSDQFCVLDTDYDTLTAIGGSAIYFSRDVWHDESKPPVCYIQADGAKTAYSKLFVSVILANGRNGSISTNAGFYNTTHKMYPFTVEPAAEVPAKTGYGLTALRMPIEVGASQKAFAYCKSGGKWYAFMAMRAAGKYQFSVPDNISGLSISVIASSNCTLAADVAVGAFTVFATNEAYLLIECS